MRSRLATWILAGLLVAFSPWASARTMAFTFGPFSIPEERPDIVVLDGRIRANDAFAFWTLIGDHPEIRTIVLSGAGGSVWETLAVAEIVRGSQMNTIVVGDAACTGTCPLIFFAGIERVAAGTLAIQKPLGNRLLPIDLPFTSAQLIADRLEVYGITYQILSRFDRLEPGEIWELSPDEIAVLAVNRPSSEGMRQLEWTTQAPRPAPDFTLPNHYVGDLMPATIAVVDAEDRIIRHEDAAVQWSAGGSHEAPTVRAIILTSVDEPYLRLIIDYVQFDMPGMPHVGGAISVAFMPVTGPPPDVARTLAFLGHLNETTAIRLDTLSLKLPTTPLSTDFVLWELGAQMPANNAVLSAAAEHSLVYQFKGQPERYILTYPVGDEGRAAFVAAMEIWGEE